MLTSNELNELALGAARSAAGIEAIKKVEVVPSQDDYERPTYIFSFLIDQGRARQRPGLVRTMLTQTIRDRLIAKGDLHYPVVRMLDHNDWEKRALA